MTTRFLSAYLIVALLGITAQADELVTLTGQTLKGTLVAVDGQNVTFKDAAGGPDARVPVKELQAVDLGNKAVALTDEMKRDEIELTDGSVIVATQVRIKGKKVEPTLLSGPNGEAAPVVDLPLGTVFAICRGAEDPKARDDWRKLVAARGKRDAFVIRQAEGLNPLLGTVIEGNAAGDSIAFEREDGQRVTLKLSRASGGLLFNQPPRDAIPPTVCKVRDVFGNVLYAQAVELTGSGLRVKTVAGATFDYPALATVSKLDFAEGNVAYLSDLTANVTAPDAVPGDPHFTFLKDRTPEGPTLRLDGATYPKGLWVFPDTVLTYKLNGDYREFKAVVGVDDRVPVANGSATVTVEADGRVLFRGAVSRKEKPKALTLDVKNVKELKITAEREALYLGSQANLADARVQK
jgi:hypothetical protein